MNFRKILIAVDESKYSKVAAQKGFQLASELKSEVLLVFIVNPIETIGTIDSVILPESVGQFEINSGYNLLDEYIKDYATGSKPEKLVKTGDPAVEILNSAIEWQTDLIVIGRHGLESFRHIVFGGVVDYVAIHSNIPVLLVPFKE